MAYARLGRWLSIPLVTLIAAMIGSHSADAQSPGARLVSPSVGEFYVSGVERSGAYALTARTITARQALLSAGAVNRDAHLVLVRLDPASDANRTYVLPLRQLFDRQAEEVPLEVGDVLMVVDEPPPAERVRPPVQEQAFTVAGDVPRPGRFGITGRRINLLQGLVLAGANPPAIGETRVTIYRIEGDDERVVYESNILELLYHPEGGVRLRDRDQVVVGDPADAPPRRP